MEKLSKRKNRVLAALDKEIEDLESKLKPYMKFLDELNQLRATRATLLNERRVTSGGRRNGTQLTMEQVIHYLEENQPAAAADMGKTLGVTPEAARSHLNRHKGTRYQRLDDGNWALTEYEEEEEED